MTPVAGVPVLGRTHISQIVKMKSSNILLSKRQMNSQAYDEQRIWWPPTCLIQDKGVVMLTIGKVKVYTNKNLHHKLNKYK